MLLRQQRLLSRKCAAARESDKRKEAAKKTSLERERASERGKWRIITPVIKKMIMREVEKIYR
jgi:hypothetical protein